MGPNRLADLRHEHGLSQAALASEMGVTTGTVWRWEKGKVAIPDAHKVTLSRRFSVSAGYLMGWELAPVGSTVTA